MTSNINIEGLFYSIGTAPSAVAGQALVANGPDTASWGVPGTVGPVPRGLTYSLQSSKGLPQFTGPVGSGAIAPIWRDQAPPRYGQTWWSASNSYVDAPIIGTGINGYKTIGLNTSGSQGHAPKLAANLPLNQYYSASELSVAGVFKYDGSHNIGTGSPYAGVYPALISESIGNYIGGPGSDNAVYGAGVGVGLDPLDATKVLVNFYANDSNGVSLDKFVQSTGVSASAAHYFVGVFGTGTISLYVDNLPAVTQSGVDLVIGVEEQTTDYIQIGWNIRSTQTRFQGEILELDGWNVALTPSEVALQQTWMKSQSGL